MSDGEWVCLEVFGHRRHFGYLSEVERFGIKMARIDEYLPGGDAAIRSHQYPGSSIFSITPVSETFARSATDARSVSQPTVQALLGDEWAIDPEDEGEE